MQIITWDCNIPQPEDQGKLLKDIIEENFIGEEGLFRDKSKTVRVGGRSSPEGSKQEWDNVYEDSYVDRDKSYCIDANYFKGGNLEQYFDKKRRQLVFCGASRGRYLIDGKRQDHKMKTAGLTTQRIEVRPDAKTNTITTVQKDNLIGCIQTGVADLNGHDVLKRTYDVEGKSPTLNACTGRNREPKITTSELTWRKLTPLECERLQTLPDFYTAEGVFVPETIEDKCAKQHVIAIIKNKNRFYVGYNRCNTPQKECPRIHMKSGEGHHICREICGQPYHAEEAACRKAGKNAKGGTLYLIGHTYFCDSCLTVMKKYGIENAIIGEYPEVEISNTQQYKVLGNGFTVDVIAHILKHLK